MTTAETTNSSANHGDALQLVTGSENGALIWNLDTESWPELACSTAGSNLTRAEWARWGPKDEQYRAICAQFSLE